MGRTEKTFKKEQGPRNKNGDCRFIKIFEGFIYQGSKKSEVRGKKIK